METMQRVKTRTSEFYANGVEVQYGDHPIAKEILVGMPQFRGKLSNYGALTQKKQSFISGHTTEVERFVKKDFEFIVFTYEAMDFSLSSMTMSESKLCTAVYWQRIK
jgi:hypothetical protein